MYVLCIAYLQIFFFYLAKNPFHSTTITWVLVVNPIGENYQKHASDDWYSVDFLIRQNLCGRRTRIVFDGYTCLYCYYRSFRAICRPPPPSIDGVVKPNIPKNVLRYDTHIAVFIFYIIWYNLNEPSSKRTTHGKKQIIIKASRGQTDVYNLCKKDFQNKTSPKNFKCYVLLGENKN